MRPTHYLAACSLLAAALLPGPALAAAPAAVSAPAGGGQQALTVGVAGGSLRASACARSPCALESGAALALPASFEAGLEGAKIRAVPLDRGRHAALVVVQDPATALRWVAVVAGPLAAGEGPRVLFEGVADPDRDPEAREPSGVETVLLEGREQILVGRRSREVDLCGRPALLAPRVLDPADLQLKAAKLQRLGQAEMAAATRLRAERRESPRPPPLGRLLSAVGASSGAAYPGALTDGDPETSWSEGRGGDGRGEFVTLRVPREVPLVSLSFTVRPPTRAVPSGAAPKNLYVATDAGLFAVSLPDDGFQHPGAVYDVTLPAPLQTSCVAVVLDEAYLPSRDAAQAAVTLAEIEARSSFDDGSDLNALVRMLSEGGARARGAGEVLMRGGQPARAAVIAGYPSLDDAGRVLALGVADQGSCEEGSPLYVLALAGGFEAEVIHARARIERCRRGALPALLAAVNDPQSPARLQAASELSLVAPAEAVLALAGGAETGAAGKSLRISLGRAASSPRSGPALVQVLGDDALPPRAALAVLRAAGDRIAAPDVRPAALRALGRVARPGAPFEERYLSLEPAARLALGGDPAAAALLDAALTDPSLPLRAAAAALAGPLAGSRERLAALARDPEPRVREASARALRKGDPASGKGPLVALTGDEWTFVRSAAYDSLAELGPDPAIDQAIAARLAEDHAPVALARAIEAASRRQAAAAGPALRALADDDKQPLDIRARSLAALGGVCHRPSVGRLVEVARRGAGAQAAADDQSLARSALVALGRLHPADLEARLAPLLGEGAARWASRAARQALEETDRCP